MRVFLFFVVLCEALAEDFGFPELVGQRLDSSKNEVSKKLIKSIIISVRVDNFVSQGRLFTFLEDVLKTSGCTQEIRKMIGSVTVNQVKIFLWLCVARKL